MIGVRIERPAGQVSISPDLARRVMERGLRWSDCFPDKIGEAMKRDFDFAKEITGIEATTLIVAGDADIFPPAHAVELFRLLGGTTPPSAIRAWRPPLSHSSREQLRRTSEGP